MPCGGLKICSEGVEGVISKGGGIRAPCGSPPSSTRVRVPGAFSSMPLIRAFWVEHARFFFLVFLLSYNGSGRKSYPPACTWFSCSSLSRAHTRTNTLDHSLSLIFSSHSLDLFYATPPHPFSPWTEIDSAIEIFSTLSRFSRFSRPHRQQVHFHLNCTLSPQMALLAEFAT